MTPRQPDLLHEPITHSVIGAFYEVHNELGFGFVESVYSAAMVLVLARRGLRVEREVPARVFLRGEPIALHRLDMVVERCVVVEVKSTSTLSKHAPRQVYNYLKATKLEVGLLLHFGPEAKFFRLIASDLRAGSTTRQKQE